jgi:hypothetical protein
VLRVGSISEAHLAMLFFLVLLKAPSSTPLPLGQRPPPVWLAESEQNISPKLGERPIFIRIFREMFSFRRFYESQSSEIRKNVLEAIAWNRIRLTQ